MTTTNLAEFGYRELEMAGELLSAYKKNQTQAVDDFFWDVGVCVMFNSMSGNVFLTNSEFQAAMINSDGILDLWHYTPYHGHEGFDADLREIWDFDPADIGKDDGEYLLSYGIITQEEFDAAFTSVA